ncbi:hypothetical protein ABEB36_000909 [Hypothenemus hampei]|uniref:Suppressor of cytokine signaling 5 n=1 Tax=Hypothenemus hampei TaxID=57062 RepID=A0ABD1FCW0_HYPHA
MDPSDKCNCGESGSSCNNSDSSKDKPKLYNFCNLRKLKRHKKSKQGCSGFLSLKKPNKWGFKCNFTTQKKKEMSQDNRTCCKCTCTGEPSASSAPVEDNQVEVVEEPSSEIEERASAPAASSNELPQVQIEQAEGVRGIYGTAMGENGAPSAFLISAPFADTPWLRMFHEDCDEAARLARAREIEQGVDPPANFKSMRRLQLLCSEPEGDSQAAPTRLQLVCPPNLNVESLRALFQNHVQLRSCPLDSIMGCHTQVGFIHCLVPDLLDINNCSFYWGKIDRYEAERLLEGKSEGTFLLRDSAQEEFLFSVSFRKYGRSLHARIEQWNHRFSFDSHDPGVFTSDTVCGLIEHYKDPSSCMFFEPMLTWPLHRNFTFSLQHLARAVIVNKLSYDNINHLQLPKTLKTYLKEYHYRQKVRVERFDDDVQWLELQNLPP